MTITIDEPLHYCGICDGPIYEGERIEDYAGLVNHYGCVCRICHCARVRPDKDVCFMCDDARERIHG